MSEINSPAELQQRSEELRSHQEIKDLNKQAGKQKKLDFSEDALAQQGFLFADTTETVAKRMELMGIERVDYRFDKATPASFKGGQFSRVREYQIRLEKESSYHQKKSDQEKAAIARGEYADYKTDKREAGLLALEQYREDHEPRALENGALAKIVFLEAPLGDTMEAMAGRIAGLMRLRDFQANYIKQYKAEKHGDIEKAYLPILQERLDVINDAIETWFIANGISLKGKDVSEKARKKALEHLSLALEKYAFYIDQENFNAMLGKTQIETAFKDKDVRKDMETFEKDIKDKEKEGKGDTAGLRADEAKEIQDLQELIVRNPKAYSQNKEVIDRVYGQILQKLREHNRRGMVYALMNNYSLKFDAQKRDFYTKNLSALSQLYGQQMDILYFQAEGDIAYLKYLLTGETGNALYATYLARQYNVRNNLDSTTPEYNKLKKQISDRIQTLNDRLEGKTEIEKAAIRRAIEKLGDEGKRTTVMGMREQLEGASDLSIDLLVAQTSLRYKEDMTEKTRSVLEENRHPEPAAGEKLPRYCTQTGRGYRDIARTFTKLGGPVTITPEEMEKKAKLLFYFQKSENTVLREAETIPEEEAAAELRGFVNELIIAIDDLHEYMEGHPGMLGERTLENLHKTDANIAAFYKKAQGIRDAFNLLSTGSAMALLNDKEFDDFCRARAEAMALNEASKSLNDLRDELGKTDSEAVLDNLAIQQMSRANIKAQRDGDFTARKPDGSKETYYDNVKRTLSEKRQARLQGAEG